MPRRWSSPQTKPLSRYPVAGLVRCTEEERGAIHANAQQAGRSASRFLAELGALDPGAKMRAPLSPEQMEQLQTLTFHLRKVGINLNQLAHRENSADYGTADPPTANEVNEAVRAVREVIARVFDVLDGPSADR